MGGFVHIGKSSFRVMTKLLDGVRIGSNVAIISYAQQSAGYAKSKSWRNT